MRKIDGLSPKFSEVSNYAISDPLIIRPQGDEPFSEMPGGRAPSFPDLSVGETPGPE